MHHALGVMSTVRGNSTPPRQISDINRAANSKRVFVQNMQEIPVPKNAYWCQIPKYLRLFLQLKLINLFTCLVHTWLALKELPAARPLPGVRLHPPPCPGGQRHCRHNQLIGHRSRDQTKAGHWPGCRHGACPSPSCLHRRHCHGRYVVAVAVVRGQHRVWLTWAVAWCRV
jgi:hypothetical protein